jgi:hypothetical protein
VECAWIENFGTPDTIGEPEPTPAEVDTYLENVSKFQPITQARINNADPAWYFDPIEAQDENDRALFATLEAEPDPETIEYNLKNRLIRKPGCDTYLEVDDLAKYPDPPPPDAIDASDLMTGAVDTDDDTDKYHQMMEDRKEYRETLKRIREKATRHVQGSSWTA